MGTQVFSTRRFGEWDPPPAKIRSLTRRSPPARRLARPDAGEGTIDGQIVPADGKQHLQRAAELAHTFVKGRNEVVTNDRSLQHNPSLR